MDPAQSIQKIIDIVLWNMDGFMYVYIKVYRDDFFYPNWHTRIRPRKWQFTLWRQT
jgi:hypothetical protein